ncbi:hypothetical protein T10_5322 [Trichinella papuae]|uniref:Uncharacterized protein n=1 Tax=Trichinella papuae TaxID=268474 RepID=A0A0V1MHH8_9BILA|nr:hypothetical protein T10_5322 [Trichinella papuae]
MKLKVVSNVLALNSHSIKHKIFKMRSHKISCNASQSKILFILWLQCGYLDLVFLIIFSLLCFFLLIKLPLELWFTSKKPIINFSHDIYPKI